MSIPTSASDLAPEPGSGQAQQGRAAEAKVKVKSAAYAAVAAGGIVLGLAFPGYVPAGSGWDAASALLAWVALVPFFFFIGRAGTRLRDDFWLSYTLALAFMVTLNYWLLAMHPLTWLGISYAASIGLVLVSWLGVSAVIGLGMALGGTFYGYVVRRLRAAAAPLWLFPLVAAAFWMPFEWLQTQGDLAYPWGPLALSQVALLPMVQITTLGGPYLLGGLIAGYNAALAEAIRTWPVRNTDRAARRAVGGVLTGFGIVLAAVLGYGVAVLKPTPDGTIPVAAVQGNFDSAQKWNPQMLGVMADTYLARSAEAAEAKIVAWPESALPILWNNAADAQTREVVSRVRGQFDGRKYLVSGGFFYRPDPTRPGSIKLFNASTAVGASEYGADLPWSAKRHLVPFGEFMPFRGILPDILAQINVLKEDLGRGDAPRPFQLPVATVGAGVCFDSIFPRALADDVRAGATLLAIVTNDAWYKKTAGPHQHFAHSILRAVENRRFLLRAANTGVSGVIDPYGRVLARAGVFEQAVVQAKVAPMTEITPYTRLGDWPALVGALALLAALGWSYRRRPLGSGFPGAGYPADQGRKCDAQGPA